MNFQSKNNEMRSGSVTSVVLIAIFALYAFSVNWKNGKIANYIASLFGLNNSSQNIVETKNFVGQGKYKDGTYVGSVEDVYYGNVEVKATISNGHMIDVAFLQYPKGRDNSAKINARAMPLLISEAISIQDSNVDTVTGATQTSKGFRNSLANALAQAK